MRFREMIPSLLLLFSMPLAAQSPAKPVESIMQDIEALRKAYGKPPPTSTRPLPSDIRALLDASVSAWNAGDLEGFVAPYANDPESAIFSAGVKHDIRGTVRAANAVMQYFSAGRGGTHGQLQYRYIDYASC